MGNRYVVTPFPFGERERDAPFWMICVHICFSFSRGIIPPNAKLHKFCHKNEAFTLFFYFAISILQKNTNIAPANVLFNGCILLFSSSSLILRAGTYSFTLHQVYPLSPLPENDDTCKQNRMTPFRAPAFSHIRRQPPEYRFSPCRSSLFVELKKRGTRLFSSLYCFSSY